VGELSRCGGELVERLKEQEERGETIEKEETGEREYRDCEDTVKVRTT
jgi:hypothetical protein